VPCRTRSRLTFGWLEHSPPPACAQRRRRRGRQPQVEEAKLYESSRQSPCQDSDLTLECPCGNILSVMHAVETDRSRRLVSSIHSSSQLRCAGRDAKNTSAGS